MTIATDLRAMRDYIAKHGFSPSVGRDGGPRCFCGARISVGAPEFRAIWYLRDFVPHNSYETLKREGWRKRDALAVLDIAADCAEAEGK